MATRSSRRGKIPIPINVPKIERDVTLVKENKRSTRGKAYKTENEETKIQEVVQPKSVLQENANIHEDLTEKRQRTTRSRKDNSQEFEVLVENVDPNRKKSRPHRRNKPVEALEKIAEIKVPEIVLRVSPTVHQKPTKRSKRQKEKKTHDVPNSQIEINSNKIKSNKKMYQQMSPSNNSNDENDKSIEEVFLVPSKRGSTESSSTSLKTRNARTRRTAKVEQNSLQDATKETNNKPGKRNAKKNRSNTKDAAEKKPDISDASHETTFHSVDQSPEMISEKDDFSFESARGFEMLNDFKHSSLTEQDIKKQTEKLIEQKPGKDSLKSITIDSSAHSILDETYPVLVDSSITSIKDVSTELNTTKTITKIFMKKSKRNVRISGIEEIQPITEASVSRNDETFTKDDSNATVTLSNASQNESRNTFAPASPCKIFNRTFSFSGRNQSDVMKTPPKAICRAISVGSAGRTPMPPPKQDATPAKGDSIQASVRRSNILNLTHSLEKGDKLAEVIAGKMRGRVTFCSPRASKTSGVSEASKIIKSNIKGSKKNFLLSGSVTRPGIRKRFLTQNDSEAQDGKTSRMTAKELAINNSVSRLSRPKTPMSEAKTKSNPGLVVPPGSRGKMPDFSAIHRRQFEQMESLLQHKVRKEARAKLLTFGTQSATKATNKSNADEEPQSKKKDPMEPKTGFTRFGFKLKTSPVKTVQEKPKWGSGIPRVKPLDKTQARQAILKDGPSLVHEKKRTEGREYLKGVRTNRRFELQMKSRNIII